MQLTTLASIAALAATALANSDAQRVNMNSTCNTAKPKVHVVNRCSYPVHLWSILTADGCPADEAAVLEPGQIYQENFRPAEGTVGVSIKVSKTDKCKGVDTVQLEYFWQNDTSYAFNFLDVSYVDCLGNECPTRQEGYYLQSGNQNGQYMKNTLNEYCPILSCSNAEECATMSYIYPNDVQTKSCDLSADLNFYMCGGEAPEDGDSYETPEAPSSSEEEEQPQATSTVEETPAYTAEPEVAAAEITPAPAPESKPPNVKTEVVYVTEYAYVNAKRHAHGHRHQHFRA